MEGRPHNKSLEIISWKQWMKIKSKEEKTNSMKKENKNSTLWRIKLCIDIK